MVKQKTPSNKPLLLTVFFLASLAFLFCCHKVVAQEYDDSELSIYITEDTTWKKGDNLLLDKYVEVSNGATLTIEPGADIKFAKDKRGYSTSLNIYDGKVLAEGTAQEPIIFSELYDDVNTTLINFEDGGHDDNGETIAGQSIFRYANVTKGGKSPQSGCIGCLGYQNFFHYFVPSVFASSTLIPAMKFNGGKLRMENCRFYGNRGADIYAYINVRSTEQDDILTIANSNFENNADDTAVVSKIYGEARNEDDKVRVLLKNNWYSSDLGPKEAPDYSSGGEKIIGKYVLGGFRSKSLIADPVIIIPGIMGSEQVGPLKTWTMDPILHTYDNLAASFLKNGYEKDKNYFEFPYQWRDSNVLTADDLKNKIESIRNDTGISKVDIVAHSMGGLVARYYIESPNYQNDVDQLVTLGTPHSGSPESYLTWEAGEVGINFEDKIIKEIFSLESHEAGYDELQKYIQES